MLNGILNPSRVGVNAVDLTTAPEPIASALRKSDSMTRAEQEAVVAHFKPSRERFIEIIGSTGYAPHVDGGGSLEVKTTAGPGGQTLAYPMFWEVPLGSPINSSFFDLHVNFKPSDDGVTEVSESQKVNEVFFVLSGDTMWWQKTDSEGVCKIEVCAGATQGWIMHYSGMNPHAAAMPSPVKAPLRILSCAVGAPTFSTFYDHPSIPTSHRWKLHDITRTK